MYILQVDSFLQVKPIFHAWTVLSHNFVSTSAECCFNLTVACCHSYSTTSVVKKLQEYVHDINENIEKLPTRGPVSKYVLPDENLRGR